MLAVAREASQLASLDSWTNGGLIIFDPETSIPASTGAVPLVQQVRACMSRATKSLQHRPNDLVVSAERLYLTIGGIRRVFSGPQPLGNHR